MPKTSGSQFELMVDYMERNGDLSKPTEGPSGRLTNIKNWAQLTELLNADSTGDTKSTEKWRKVWSDLKNNTKRKAARINRAASGTGGGPALKIKLSELEERVINIIGRKAATGMDEIMEIGDIRSEDQASTSRAPVVPIQVLELSEEMIDSAIVIPQVSMSSPLRVPAPPSPLPVPAPPSPLPVPAPPSQPPPSRQHPRQHRDHRRRSPLQRRHRSNADQAREAFLQSDSEWRNYLIRSDTESLRLREIELQNQARWQDLFAQFLLTLNLFVTHLRQS